MSIHEDITRAIQDEIDALRDAVEISPTKVASGAQSRLCPGDIEPRIRYASLEHLKQIARKALAKRFDAESDESEAHQGEMFSGQLQEHYPTQHKRGDEPSYKRLADLAPDDVAWNVNQLRLSGTARLKHADALEAWAIRQGLMA